MELIESSLEVLACGEPCIYHHPPPPMWHGKSINPKCLIHTLVRILKSKISEDQIKRQLYLLKDLKIGLTVGFWVQDIGNCTQLIELLLCKCEFIEEFCEYLWFLLDMMKYPPLLCRTNEILEFEREVEEYFSFFGYILVTTAKPAVREIILQSFKTMIKMKEQVVCYSMSYYMMAVYVERSKLPLILCSYMEFCSDDTYFELVEILGDLATFSSSMKLFLACNVLQTLMIRLDPDWQERFGGPRPIYTDLVPKIEYPLDDSIMLIHDLLSEYQKLPLSDEIRKNTKAPSVEALWGLRYLLHIYAVDERYKNERNFIASLWLLFIQCFPDAKYVQSGIVHDFAILTKMGDATLGGTWAATIKCKIDDLEDYEFKRMMIFGVISCNQCLGATRIYSDENVTFMLCKLLDGNVTRWAPQFHEQLQTTALFALQEMLEEHLYEFCHAEGPDRLEKLIVELNEEEKYDLRFELLQQALRLVWKLLHINRVLQYPESLPEAYMERLRKLLKGVYEKLFKLDFKLKYQQLMMQIYDNIAEMYHEDTADDVERIIRLFQRILDPRPKEAAYSNKFLISALILLWKTGTHHEVNFLYFIKLKGVYLLLDIVKDAHFHVQLVSLGFLADLLNEGTAIPYFMTWQKDGMNALSLLLEIFRQENVSLGVLSLPRGIIKDIKYPLMGCKQREALETPDYDFETQSPTLSDIFMSCRPRIYAITQNLRSEFPDTLELVNDYYKLYDSNLSTNDKITMLLVDNYYTLKIAEMWMEVDISMRPIEPTPNDQEMLDIILEQFREHSKHIQSMQMKFLEIENKLEHYTEEEFYKLLRETKLGPTIEALSEMRYIARAADSSFRKPLAATNVPDETGMVEMHRTLQQINNFFYAFNQKMSIQSDIIVDPFAPSPPKPVSEDGDERISMYDGEISDVSSAIEVSCSQMNGNQKRKSPKTQSK